MCPDAFEIVPSRFVVGIDLGTTNCAVCFVDTAAANWRVKTFRIPQLVAAGVQEDRDTLPSFLYQPVSSEDADADLRMPWQKAGSVENAEDANAISNSPHMIVGAMARDEGRLAPGRLVASAKSWLSHPGVDRTAELLPWQSTEDVKRMSPIEASACYLRHIRLAWNACHQDEPLEEQDVVLTLPASFDEVARELTVQAATEAGLPKVILIEEPQAAFYSWVYQHQDRWQSIVSAGDKILVCDIGGGTTDFTLIRARRAGEGQEDQRIQFHRIAVGDHLILGGDNLDLALARFLEPRLADNGQLAGRQWDVLVRSCRQAKEILLGHDPPDSYTVNVLGGGSRLLQQTKSAHVSRDEAEAHLLEGFLPDVTLDERPTQGVSGFQEFGLPYAADPAMTRHLAAFLTTHRHADDYHDSNATSVGHDPARPDLILLNGGMFASPVVRERLLMQVRRWFGNGSENQSASNQSASNSWSPRLLENDRLDMAVARGAAYYGMVRRGQGVRIAAGLARSYYLQIGQHRQDSSKAATTPSALCVVPGSAQPGDRVDLLERPFDLRVSEPVEFPLYASSRRLTDQPGEIVPVDAEQMRSLAPLRTVLRTQRKNQRGTVPVHLHAQLSEIGTIELWCTQTDAPDRRWRLQFDVRAATETDRLADTAQDEDQGVLDEQTWERCYQILNETFGPDAIIKPNKVNYHLQQALDLPRDQWPMSLLRRIWEALIQLQDGRMHSNAHEARWLNLAGFALRPGYGMALDDWRVTETWRITQGRLIHHAAACRTQSWILWRRVAGGLPAGQQRSIAEPLMAAIRSLHRRSTGGGVKGEVHFSIADFAEVWRLLGSLERLHLATKIELGRMLLDLAEKRKFQSVGEAIYWSVGRLGSRTPVYGPLNLVISPELAKQWLDRLMHIGAGEPMAAFAVMMIARKTGDRHRDVDWSTRQSVVHWLESPDVPKHWIRLVAEGGQLDEEEQNKAFGESLPLGLVL